MAYNKMDTVTKSKNEGRVGAGKRNRKNKADFINSKGQVDSSDEPIVQVSTSPAEKKLIPVATR